MNNDFDKSRLSGTSTDLQSESSLHKDQLRAQLEMNFKDRKTTRTRSVAVALAAFVIILSTGQSTNVGSDGWSLIDGKRHDDGFQIFQTTFTKTNYSNSGMKDETRDEYRSKLELVDEATAAKDYKILGVTGFTVYGNTWYLEEREYSINGETHVFHTNTGSFSAGKREAMVIIAEWENISEAIETGALKVGRRETHIVNGIPYSFKVWVSTFEKYGDVEFMEAEFMESIKFKD